MKRIILILLMLAGGALWEAKAGGALHRTRPTMSTITVTASATSTASASANANESGVPIVVPGPNSTPTFWPPDEFYPTPPTPESGYPGMTEQPYPAPMGTAAATSTAVPTETHVTRTPGPTKTFTSVPTSTPSATDVYP